ncbi:MAG: hypothetical protein AAFW73_24465 [Bacteroidota bacterium]
MRAPNLGVVLILLSLAVGWWSCTTSVQSSEELQDYVRNERNGLQQGKTFGPVEVQVTYRPPDLLAAQEMRGQEGNDVLLDSLRRGYGKFAHFVLSLSAGGKEVETYNLQSGFGDRVTTLAFGMKEYVYLLTSQRDTIPAADYFYQRTYGVGGASELLFAFDRSKIEATDWFQFVVDEFGLGVGNTRFRFEVGDLAKTPQIEYQ